MMTLPQSPEGRDPGTETPVAGATPAPEEQQQPSPPSTAQNETAPPTAAANERPHRHRRRRRRRRRPPNLDAAGKDTASAPEIPVIAEATPTQEAVTSASSPTMSEQPAPAEAPAENVQRQGRRRRRRRRHPGREGAAASGSASVAPVEAAGSPSPGEAKEPRRDREHRRRAWRGQAAQEERPRDRENRGDRWNKFGRKGGDDRAGKGKGGRRGPEKRHGGRPRHDLSKKPEPKIYRLESVVDHGFEDVADPASEGATRRSDWTILKRTSADQRTGRAVSSTYVLRRDGTDTEFPQLSAARAAVHKTIVHPERLTLSKADHAAARGAKK